MRSLLALLVTLLAAFSGRAETPAELRFDFGPVARLFRVDGRGLLTTSGFDGPGVRIPVESTEFRFELADGQVLTAEDFTSHRFLPLPPEFESHGFALRFEAAAQPWAALVCYFGPRDAPWMFKEVRLEVAESVAAPPLLTEVTVERLTPMGAAPFTGGGRGRLATSQRGAFIGLMHPSGDVLVTGTGVTLVHHPAVGLDPAPADVQQGWRAYPWSERAVIGLSPAAALAATFEQLLDSERRPLAPLHLTWTAGDADGKALLARLPGLVGNAKRQLGESLSSIHLDDGWRAPDRLFEPSPARFPDGLGAVAKAARAEGVALALTLPFVNQDGSALDLASAAARRVALKALVARVQEGGDKQTLGWIEHALPPDGPEQPLLEAQVEGEIEFLKTERRLAPDAIVSLTGAPFADPARPPSPWWLLHADLLRTATTPVADTLAVPELAAADRQWTLEDAARWPVGSDLVGTLPLAGMLPAAGLPRLVTATGLREARDVRELVDAALWLAGTGVPIAQVVLKESGPGFDGVGANRDPLAPLVQALRWARARGNVLGLPHRFGGAPLRGEPYGALHRDEKDDQPRLVVLRNPAPRPQAVTLPKVASPWLKTYPWCEVVAVQEGGSASVTLAPHEVAIFETGAGLSALRQLPAPGRFLVDSDDGQQPFRLLVAPKTTRSITWLDATTGAPGPAAQAGASGAFGLRDPQQPFAPTLLSLISDADGAISVKFATGTRCHRGETLAFDLVLEGIDGAAAGEPQVVCDVPVATSSARGPTWICWRGILEETRQEVTLAVTVAKARVPDPAPTAGVARATLLATRRAALESVTLFRPLPATGLPTLPPQTFARDEATLTLLADGPLPPLVKTDASQ